MPGGAVAATGAAADRPFDVKRMSGEEGSRLAQAGQFAAFLPDEVPADTVGRPAGAFDPVRKNLPASRLQPMRSGRLPARGGPWRARLD